MSSIFILANNINNYSEKQKNKIYKLENRLKKKYDKVGNSLYIDIFTNSLSMKWLASTNSAAALTPSSLIS